MGEAIAEQRVVCRQCRYRFPVAVVAGDRWAVEAQCPSCDSWAWFTTADTHDPPRPDSSEREAEVQRVGEWLWRPINEHRGHPAVAWLNGVGNGLFEDDHTRGCWPVPHWVYRFTRGKSVAYIWQQDGSWRVCGWHSLQSRPTPREPIEASSFGAALDRLAEGATAQGGA